MVDDEETIDPQRREIISRQAFRYAVLRCVHTLVSGRTGLYDTTTRTDVARQEGLEPQSIDLLAALRYLEGEKLITGGHDTFHKFWLTHVGLVEVEAAILNPDRGTKRFEASITRGYAKAAAARQIQVGPPP